MKENLREKFKEAARIYAQSAAIQYKKENAWKDISYCEFADEAEFLAGWLLQEGIGKGDNIALMLHNRPEWPLIFFAVVTIGAVAVPLNPESSEQELETILRDAQCKALFTSRELLSKNAHLAERLSLKRIISVDSEEFIGAVKVSERIADREIEISPRDAACILYTSGTTDQPKGVTLSHKNLLSNCESLGGLHLFKPAHSIFSILPLHHAYPLTVTMFLPLFNGGKIIYPGTLKGEELIKSMQETNPDFFVAVPGVFYLFYQRIREHILKLPAALRVLFWVMIELLYRLRNRTGVNLARFLLRSVHKKFGKSLCLFVSGGAKLSEDVAKTLFKWGFTILEGYGLTETSPVLTMTPLRKPKIGSVGVPIPGVEVKIKEKDKDGIGEILARGANVMEGYYRREDLTAQVIKDGWFYTGDLGYLDNEGYLFLTGRLKEIIVLSSGLNIYPEEIEEVYSKHVPVKEMCVFEVPAQRDAGRSLILWTVIVPDTEFFRRYGGVNIRSVIKERLANVSKTLPSYKRIMGFSITLEKLPRTLLGKIKRFAVKEIYTPGILQEEEYAAPHKELSQEELTIMEWESSKKIIEYFQAKAGVKKKISLNDLLELDLGIDSLGRVELASALEEIFKIKVDYEIVGNAFTVKELITGIESLLKEEKEILAVDEKEITSESEYWKKMIQILPQEEDLKNIDLHPDFGARLFTFIFAHMLYILFKIFYNLKVEGKRNIPGEGPYILYVNHTSYFDGVLIAAALPFPLHLDTFFLGLRVYFDFPILRSLVKAGRIIPLDFCLRPLEAIRSCYYVLQHKKNLCIFPEGMRSLNGTINEFKRGFGILAKESKTKLVPVFLEGAYLAWPRTSKFPKRHPIMVRFGKPLNSEEVEAKGYISGAQDSYSAFLIGARNALISLKDGKGIERDI